MGTVGECQGFDLFLEVGELGEIVFYYYCEVFLGFVVFYLQAFFEGFEGVFQVEPDEFLVADFYRPGNLGCLGRMIWVSLTSQFINIGSNFLKPMFRPNNKKTEPLPLPLQTLPILIRLRIAMFLHSKTRIPQFLTIDKINIRTISLIFKFISFFLNIF